VNPQTEAENQRILDLLRTLIRVLGFSNREIERRIGLSPSYLSRLFGGYLELKFEHVLEISRALGLEPGEVFELAYPESSEPPSESMESFRNVLDTLQPKRPAAEPTPKPAPKPLPGFSTEEVERSVQDGLRQALLDLTRRGSGGSG
jgi:transcriptional regulator with XRE-family HTH domain